MAVSYSETIGVTESTFQAAKERLGAKGLTDLTVVIGYYGILCYAMIAFDVDLPPDATPLP